jgi:protein-S-isoprenylcysteine O-methyltransferase Ste14
MVKLIVFATVSACLIYISRTSLLAPRSHGFHRFFAWEFIVALILLNVEKWFHDPFSWYQIISWFLLFVSIVPLALGIRSLLGRGRPAEHREDDVNLLGFEKTTELVTTGIYRHIRHPMYASLLYLAWGVFFKDPSLSGALLVFPATLFLLTTAKADERECIRYFGEHYRKYMEKTRMFVPFLF